MGWLRAVAAACGLVGCTGEVSVYLTDKSQEAPGGELGIKAFELPLDHVDVQLDGEWVPLARGPDPYNLLDFSGEPTNVDLLALRELPARIAHDEVQVGDITALRLVLMAGEAFTLMTMDGVARPLTVPPDATWEVAVDLAVDPDEAAERTLDLHVRDCVFEEADGTWTFVPTLLPG